MGKDIFKNHCTDGHADASYRHISHILTFKARGIGGIRGGKLTEKKSVRIFSHFQVAIKLNSFM